LEPMGEGGRRENKLNGCEQKVLKGLQKTEKMKRKTKKRREARERRPEGVKN